MAGYGGFGMGYTASDVLPYDVPVKEEENQVRDLLIKRAKEVVSEAASLGRQVPAGIVDIASGATWALGDGIQLLTPYLPEDEQGYIRGFAEGTSNTLKEAARNTQDVADYIAGGDDNMGTVHGIIRGAPASMLSKFGPVGKAVGGLTHYGNAALRQEEEENYEDKDLNRFGALATAGAALLGDNLDIKALKEAGKNVDNMQNAYYARKGLRRPVKGAPGRTYRPPGVREYRGLTKPQAAWMYAREGGKAGGKTAGLAGATYGSEEAIDAYKGAQNVSEKPKEKKKREEKPQKAQNNLKGIFSEYSGLSRIEDS